jgi:Cu-processing system ATP-binding protein
MNGSVIDVRNVTKRYGDHAAVDAVSLSVGAGESLALLGHNGAGKTTLMKLMLGLTRPSGGDMRVLDAEPGRAAVDARRAIGFLPENVTFHDSMSGRAMLRFYARLKGVPAEQCESLLDQVGLADAAARRIKTYSKGMRQRLGLAQALLGQPKLLLLDEPTSGLDPTLRLSFYQTVHEMAEAGTTVLLSSHALTEVEAQTDRVAIMKHGKLVACGTLEELRHAAALPVQIRVSFVPGNGDAVAERFGAAVSKRVNDHAVDLVCAPDDKMAMVRHIAGLDRLVEDVEIHPPTLDALYAHYRDEEVSP